MTWRPWSRARSGSRICRAQALLYLLFRSGEVYRYFDVPRWQYQEFLAADSKGRYFGRNIRGYFRYERCAGHSEDSPCIENFS